MSDFAGETLGCVAAAVGAVVGFIVTALIVVALGYLAHVGWRWGA